MNWTKTKFYVLHNPALAIQAAWAAFLVKHGRLSKAQLFPVVKRADSALWHNDFKCQTCYRFIGERHVQDDRKSAQCPGCVEWFARTGTEIFTTALKGNFYRSGDPEVGYVIEKYLKVDDVFVDVGTCIGYFTTLALAICGRKGRVVSFEPMPLFAENMEFIKARNPWANWTYEAAAVSDKTGEATLMVPSHFHLSSGFVGNGSTTNRDFLGDLVPLTVRKVCLEDYFGAEQRCDFIKVDVEGHEPAVLSSIFRAFTRAKTPARPHVVFEHEDRNYSSAQLEELRQLLKRFAQSGWDVLYAGTEQDALRNFSAIAHRAHIHLRPH